MEIEVIQHSDGTWGVYEHDWLIYSDSRFDAAMDAAREFDQQWEAGEVIEFEVEPE